MMSDSVISMVESGVVPKEPRVILIGMIYRLHGSLRNLFAGPNANTGLVLLEALTLSIVGAEREAPTVSDIGRKLGFSRQAIQRAANKLLELSLVETRPNPNHKRAPVFVTTALGDQRILEVRAPAQHLADSLANEFDDARSLRLILELDDLLAAIGAKTRELD